MTTVERPYRGVSALDRRRERRDLLLSACLDVVGREGLAATTVGAICEQAGLTKRYFYESFADRDAILVEALDGLHHTLLDQIRTALTDVEDPVERTQVTVELLLDAMDDPRMARLFMEAVALPALQDARRRAYDVYADLIVHEVLGIKDPSPRAQLAALVFATGATEAVARWLHGDLDLKRDEVVATLVALGTRTGRADRSY